MSASPEISPLAVVSTSCQVKEKNTPDPEASGEEEEKKENDNLVEVYADRLCAVTHAFALCCSTLQKSCGK